MPEPYVASDGSCWHLIEERPPIPDRQFDWCALLNGEGDGVVRYGATRETCVAAIEEWVEENT